MFVVQNRLLRQVLEAPLSAQDRITAVALVLDASEAGGYVLDAPGTILEALEGVQLVASDHRKSGWYFPALRSRARYLDRHKRRHANSKKRSNATPDAPGAEGVGSGGVMVGGGGVNKKGGPGGGKEEGAGEGEEAAKGEGKRRNAAPQCDDSAATRRLVGGDLPGQGGYLFQDIVPPTQVQEPTLTDPVDPARKPKKARKAREPKPLDPSKPSRNDPDWDPMWRAVAQLTGADPVVSKGHISKIVSLLLQAQPRYTVEEINTLPILLSKTQWFDGKLSCGMIEKHIGLVRATKAAPAKVPIAERKITVHDLNPNELRLYGIGERNPRVAHMKEQAFAMARKRLAAEEIAEQHAADARRI